MDTRTRRDLLRRGLVGEHSVSARAAKIDMSFAAVQKHASVLERAGPLSKRRSGSEQLEKVFDPPTFPATFVEYDLAADGRAHEFMTSRSVRSTTANLGGPRAGPLDWQRCRATDSLAV